MSSAILELEAMKKVAEAIAGLEPEARTRVLTWAVDHYSIGTLKIGSQKPINIHPTPDAPTTSSRSADSIGDLFAMAQPSSDAEKALVADY